MWKEYAVHYAVVLLVYAIMFGVVLWHIQTPRRRRRAARTGDAPPRSALVQDIPPEALRTLTRDSFTQSLLEMRMLDDVLAARGAAASACPHHGRMRGFAAVWRRQTQFGAPRCASRAGPAAAVCCAAGIARKAAR